jgi:hypothetical protein
LERERVRLSHDLFCNAFGGLLLPGFYDERLTERDVVLRAIKGDATCRAEALVPALALWRRSVGPALSRFIDDVTVRYGFVTSDSWDQIVTSVREAAARLDVFDWKAICHDQAALDAAKAFWADCDVIRGFLASIHKSFSIYFLRWDPTRIRGSDHA